MSTTFAPSFIQECYHSTESVVLRTYRFELMKFRLVILLIVTHVFIGFLGFAAGIYVLPILTAPEPPNIQAVESVASQSRYETAFQRTLEDSDALHWGEGSVFVGEQYIALQGELSPGPDFRLYLSHQFVETEAEFLRLKSTMALVGDVKTFENFIVSVPTQINPEDFTTVIVWCESFNQFITAAKYQ